MGHSVRISYTVSPEVCNAKMEIEKRPPLKKPTHAFYLSLSFSIYLSLSLSYLRITMQGVIWQTRKCGLLFVPKSQAGIVLLRCERKYDADMCHANFFSRINSMNQLELEYFTSCCYLSYSTLFREARCYKCILFQKMKFFYFKMNQNLSQVEWNVKL